MTYSLDSWARYTPIGGQDTSKPLPYDPSDSISKQVQSSCKKSLSNLRTTYLDSYILHSPLPTIEQTLEAWHALMKLQDEGTVRLIGVSNTYDVRILQALQKARKVQVVQNRWYEGNNWDQQVFNYCKELGIMYQYVISIPSSTKSLQLCDSQSLVSRSFWSLSGSPSLLTHPAVLQLANMYNLTAAQIVYRVAQNEGATPLSGTTNEVHMCEDVAVKGISFADEGTEELLQSVREFIKGR